MDKQNPLKIWVVGVGGAGGNVINQMIDTGLNGVEVMAINSDARLLEISRAPHRIQIGRLVTQGFGAGARPEVGRKAIEEDRDRVVRALAGSDVVFILAGLGGGTGTGAAPIVAQIARDGGAFTIGIVTTPFKWEGNARKANAEQGVVQMQESADASLVISNQHLLATPTEDLPITQAFQSADRVLLKVTRALSDLIALQGSINLSSVTEILSKWFERLGGDM